MPAKHSRESGIRKSSFLHKGWQAFPLLKRGGYGWIIMRFDIGKRALIPSADNQLFPSVEAAIEEACNHIDLNFL